MLVNGPVDRESISSYRLLLTIADNGNPTQSTNVSLSISILDENDHCPQLHIESPFIMINRDINQQDFSLHLIASDNDEDVNGQVTFELSPLTAPSFVRLHANGTLLVQTNSSLIEDEQVVVLHVQISDHGQPTPCLIVETLRFFLGSNRTDWSAVLKHNDQAPSVSAVCFSPNGCFANVSFQRLVIEQLQHDERAAHGSVTPPTRKSSRLFSSSLSLSAFTSGKQMLIVTVAGSLLLTIVIISMCVCLVDRCRRKSNKRHPLIKTNGLANGKRIASSSPLKTRLCYEDDSPTHRYATGKSMKPIGVVAGSSSQSSSSVESSARMTNTHERSFNPTYSYTAIGTSDDLTPMDFDDEYNDGMHSGIELMMTTV